MLHLMVQAEPGRMRRLVVQAETGRMRRLVVQAEMGRMHRLVVPTEIERMHRLVVSTEIERMLCLVVQAEMGRMHHGGVVVEPSRRWETEYGRWLLQRGCGGEGRTWKGTWVRWRRWWTVAAVAGTVEDGL
jgi:hypothetical protein